MGRRPLYGRQWPIKDRPLAEGEAGHRWRQYEVQKQAGGCFHPESGHGGTFTVALPSSQGLTDFSCHRMDCLDWITSAWSSLKNLGPRRASRKLFWQQHLGSQSEVPSIDQTGGRKTLVGTRRASPLKKRLQNLLDYCLLVRPDVASRLDRKRSTRYSFPLNQTDASWSDS